MNQLETNLALWAICSILLFEILIILCLCRCWFNRLRPKKFYVKRDEYEYLQGINGGTQSKYQSTVLRPPHADELAHVGTLRLPNSLTGFPNFGFYRDEKDERISSSQQWLELQPSMINTAQLPPADYEIHPYRTDDYSYRQPPPRPTFIDFHQYRNDDNDMENYHFESFRRPSIILPEVKRLDTSTEYYGVQYTNVVPKSILKSGTSTTPPVDLPSSVYLQVDRSRTSSDNDESPRTSMKMNTDQSISLDYPINLFEKRIPIEPILSPAIASLSKFRMNFANVSQLNDIEWELPGEFRTIFQSNNERNSSAILDSRIPRSWERETNISQSHYLWEGDITQQQAFEY